MYVDLHLENLGTLRIALDAERVPKTVANFLGYVESGHYTNTIFHRVIPGFMVQGGGFAPDMQQKSAPQTVENEATTAAPNLRYTVAMARTSDPHSASAQFFINTADNDFLNHTSPSPQGWGYCVFGTVVRGQALVDAIENVATGRKGFHENVPRQPVVIARAEIVRETQPSLAKAADPEAGTLATSAAAPSVKKVRAPRKTTGSVGAGSGRKPGRPSKKRQTKS